MDSFRTTFLKCRKSSLSLVLSVRSILFVCSEPGRRLNKINCIPTNKQILFEIDRCFQLWPNGNRTQYTTTTNKTRSREKLWKFKSKYTLNSQCTIIPMIEILCSKAEQHPAHNDEPTPIIPNKWKNGERREHVPIVVVEQKALT